MSHGFVGSVLGLLVSLLAAETGYGGDGQSSANGRYLRPPDFKAPVGRHFVPTGKEMPGNVRTRCTALNPSSLLLHGAYTKLFVKYAPSGKDYETMVRILSDRRLVGDGTYIDVGLEVGRDEASFCASSDGSACPPGNAASGYLRKYVSGAGVSRDVLLKEFGQPREQRKAIGPDVGTYVTYGHVSVVYGKTDEFLGVVFFYPSQQMLREIDLKQFRAEDVPNYPGRSVQWKGVIGKVEKGPQVVISLRLDEARAYIALVTLRAKPERMPALGSTVTIRGKVEPGLTRGTDYIYARDGSRKERTTIYLSVTGGELVE